MRDEELQVNTGIVSARRGLIPKDALDGIKSKPKGFQTLSGRSLSGLCGHLVDNQKRNLGSKMRAGQQRQRKK